MWCGEKQLIFFRLCRNITFKINIARFKENYFLWGLKASLYCLLPKYSHWNGNYLCSTPSSQCKSVIGMWPCVNGRNLVLCIVKLYFYIWSRDQAVFWVWFFFQSLPLLRTWSLHSIAPSKKEWPTSASRSRALQKVSVVVTPGSDKRIFFCWPLQITTLL